MKALDLSFDAGKVTPAWAAARLAEGWELLIVNLWTGRQTPAGAADALHVWREAGGVTAAYFVVHDGRSAEDHFRQAHSAAAAEWKHLSFVAVDVEVAPTSAATVRAACELVRANGQRPVVYTSVSKWRELCGDVPSLRDIPLWDASYGQEPSLQMRPQYGGWQIRTGHQYQGTTDLDGIAVDLNLFDDVFVLGGDAPAAAPPPTPAAVRQHFDNLWHVAGLLDSISAHDLAGVVRTAVVEIKAEYNVP